MVFVEMDMKTVFLFDNDTKVPVWWANYVDYTNEEYDFHTIDGDYLCGFHDRLAKEYRAKIKYSEGVRTLIFEDERDYMAMVLKWS